LKKDKYREKSEHESENLENNLEILAEVRTRFLMELKSCYWELFESNQCSGDSLAVLIQSANWDLDNYRNEMQSWEWLKSHYDEDLNMILFKIRQWPIIGSYARNYLYNFIAYFYDLYSTYIEGL
jgi:hypothetical protein